ncbi:MAG TPA: MarR family winged helix-turn-helix transcriptional regulator [Solirubrobacteraceae bacterium]|nr:MarR family winged helix-turn-helix transcriptional regulator [Solirubrobacteraceae bacterium]
MEQDLSRTLHTLTARLDRGADALLRDEAGMSYSRFLALFMIGSFGADTQRVLAQRLGVTEPSASRMTRVLADTGLVQVIPDPAGGHRHQLRLTASGAQLVHAWGGLLEERLAALVESAGVPYGTYLKYTKRVLERLDAQPAAARASSPGRMSR